MVMDNTFKEMLQFKKLFLSICILTISTQGIAETVDDEQTDVPEVEVIGRTIKDSVMQNEQNQFSLSAEEVINMPGTGDDPLSALDNIPGINQAGAGVYMHGSSTTDNRLLIDNLTVPYLYHYGDSLSLVSKDILSGFDVYPSGFNASYGNRLGGVIDVELRDPLKDGRTHHRLHVGTFDASYFIEGEMGDNDSGYFSIRRSHLDLLLSGTSFEDVDLIQFPRFVDSVGRWRHELENGEINTTLIASTDELIFDLGDKAVEDDKAAIGRLEAKQSFISFGSQYSAEINESLFQATTLKYINSRSELKIGQQQATDPNPGEPYNFDFELKEIGLNPVLFWYLNNTDEVKIGAELTNGKAELTGYISAPPDERDNPSDNLTNSEKFELNENIDYSGSALFLSYEKHWNNYFSSTFSIRHESIKLYDKDIIAPLSPRLSISHEVTDDLKITASYGIYYQSPQGFELSESLGNPDLEYQRAEHRTVGFHSQLNENWSMQFSVYQKPMTDLVADTEDGSNYNNNGTGEARGFDLYIKRVPEIGRLDWISYTYAESDRINHNNGLSRPFDGDQTHTLVWVHQQPFSGMWSDWQWGFKFKTHTGQPYTRVIDREALTLDPDTICDNDGGAENCYWSPIYEKQNNSRLPAYFNIDLSMNKSVENNRRKYDIKLELINASALIYENIGDYDYGDDYEFIDDPKKVSSSFGFLPAASFTYYF